jgi:hypothetical protein
LCLARIRSREIAGGLIITRRTVILADGTATIGIQKKSPSGPFVNASNFKHNNVEPRQRINDTKIVPWSKASA